MPRKEILLFKASECEPCREIDEFIKNGRFESDLEGEIGVRIVDITSEEGFAELQLHPDIEAIPSAKHGNKLCRISIDHEDGVVIFTCEGEAKGTPSAEGQHKDTPGQPA